MNFNFNFLINKFNIIKILNKNIISFFYFYTFILVYGGSFFKIDSNFILFITFSLFLFIIHYIFNSFKTINFSHIIFNNLEKILNLVYFFKLFLKIKLIQISLEQNIFIIKTLNNLFYISNINVDLNFYIRNNLYIKLLLLNNF